MSKHLASISWKRNDADFLANKYSRAHSWQFDGGCEIAASASPQIVPLPYSRAENVDPEEAFVASLASCHMLFFLALAAEHGFQVESYTDKAEGKMARNALGKIAITAVGLYPRAEFSGSTLPEQAEIEKLHHLAHEQCFIANSVTTQISINLTDSI